MRDVLHDIAKWMGSGEPIALATVIQTWGSSPRAVGAKMAMTPQGKISGSVSGGCVEGAVYQAAMEVLDENQPRLMHFGVADETAWQVGLACGGTIEVFVQPLGQSAFETWQAALQGGRPLASVTLVGGPQHLLGKTALFTTTGKGDGDLYPSFSELDQNWEAQARQAARQALAQRQSQRLPLQVAGAEPAEAFIELTLPPPTLVMVGGVHIAIALTSIAHTLGYRTVVVDPRRAFGSAERFAHGDQLIQAWPEQAFAQIELNEDTAVAMLTHDPKIDDPALKVALNSPAFYIGALGSQTTQGKRRKRLQEAGFSAEQIARIHGPIGLELGAETPEEIALAIMGEIVAARHGASV